MKIAVTLCTRKRPQMLGDCLKSLFDQAFPPDVSLALIVVENDDHAHSREMVEALARERGSPPVTYAHEPRLGIPFARNRALALALKHDPDWIGFIDDDEVASSNWIRNFVQAANSVPCDVLQGPVEYHYPTSTPSWMPLPTRKHQPTGQVLRTAATNNTFMRARIARWDGLGLRFNEDMRFTGGSDNEYFYRATDLGARICWMDEAVVHENVPKNRITLRWQIGRCHRVAANTVLIHRNRLGLFPTITKCGTKYTSRILYALIIAPIAVAVALFRRDMGKRMLFSSLRQVSSGFGGLGAFFAFQPEPYKTIDSQEREAFDDAVQSFRSSFGNLLSNAITAYVFGVFRSRAGRPGSDIVLIPGRPTSKTT